MTRSSRNRREEIEILSIAAGGAGVGKLRDGRTVFVPRTAPGDRVLIEIRAEKKRWCRAEVVDLQVSGPDRREAPCPLYGKCGGCSLQHLDYRAQLYWKERIVGDALTRVGGRPTDSVQVVPTDPPIRYRNRLSLRLRRLPGGRVVAGFHHRNAPTRVLDMSGECLLPDARLLETWQGLRANWGRGADRLPGGRELRLTLRQGDDGSVLSIKGGRGEGDPSAMVSDVTGLCSVFRETRDGKVRHLAGASGAVSRWLGETIKVGGRGFLQVNDRTAQAVHEYVLNEVADSEGAKVVDAYCGVGILGHLLARTGATVIGIEADSEAADAAKGWRGPNFRVIQGRVEDHLAGVLPTDYLILNPPRSGLDPSIPDLLHQRPPRRIVYVSCDPATLARDIKRLGRGYEIRKLRAFDLFPQTAHVETVATMDGPGEPAP